MALDHFAIASFGAYPTPTPSDAARAAYAVTHGLLGTLPLIVITGYFWGRFHLGLTIVKGPIAK